MNGVDITSLMELAAAMAAVGVVAGLLAGLLGVGGGIVTVPVLSIVLGVLGVDPALSMHVAVGTSLGAIIPTSIVSARSHRARGGVEIELLWLWGPAIFIGACCGALAAGQMRGPTLNAIFAVGAFAVAIYMLVAREPSTGGQSPGRNLQRVIASAIGALSTMMGIGGGTFTVPVLAAFGTAVRQAVGTSAALGIVISIPGTIGFMASGRGEPNLPPFSLGYVNMIGVGLLVPMAMTFAPVGARLAHRISPRHLRFAFAAFLLATAAKMAATFL